MKLFMLLLFLVSLALAVEITSSAPSLDDTGVVETSDSSDSNTGFLSLFSRQNARVKAAPKKGKCKVDKDCGKGNVECMGGFCINHDVTVEASPTGDAMCRTNKDCGKDGKCMSGLCLASSKLRFARRSPQVQCHKDKDCASPEGPGKCIAGGVCIAPDRKLKERTPQVQCHNDKDCASPDGPGKCIAGGICIAPDRKLKERSVDSESTHDELGTRSPQVQCRKDKDCASPEGPGKCIAGGICIAPDRKLKTREPVDSAHDELVTRSPQLMCKHDKDCASPEGPGKCIAGGICIAPNRK